MRATKPAAVVLALACAAASAAAASGSTCADYRTTSGNRLYSVRGISFTDVGLAAPQAVPVRLLRQAARGAGLRGKIFYRAALVDLGGDRRRELVFHPLTPSFCGTGGCTTFVFRADRARLTEVARIPVTRTPLVVASRRTRGWRELVFAVAGGAMRADWGVVRWNGRRYAGNPTVDLVPARARLRGVALLRNPRACRLADEESFRA